VSNSLDLRPEGELSVEDSKAITKIELSLRNEYTHFIGDLVQLNKVNGLQWLLKVTCRNTYDSVIYDSMARIALLDYNLKNGASYSTILVKNLFLSEVVAQLLDRYNSKSKIIITNNFIDHFKVVKNICVNVIFCLALWFVSRFFKKTKPIGSIILLDTFFLDKDNLFDHYYPGLKEKLSANIYNKIWALPTFLRPKYPWGWVGIFRRISQYQKNIILRESWLTINDYFFALKESLIVTKKIKNFPKWRGLDVSSIIKYDLSSDQGSYSISYKILTYLSFKNFKKEGFEIETIIDWYENQTIDRALYLGANENYPETDIKGYLGFVPESYYVGISPTIYEKNGGVLPTKFYVMGDAYINTIKKYMPELKVSVAPAFRFSGIREFKRNSNTKRNIILLALPYSMNESINIIQLVYSSNIKNKYKILIKPHPTQSIQKIKLHFPTLKSTDFIFDKLIDIFQSVRLLVSSASSVVMEAAICNVHVAIVASRNGPTINPLTGLVDDTFWTICYESEDINYLLSAKKENLNHNTLDVNNYFESVTKENALDFISD